MPSNILFSSNFKRNTFNLNSNHDKLWLISTIYFFLYKIDLEIQLNSIWYPLKFTKYYLHLSFKKKIYIYCHTLWGFCDSINWTC